jgi:hypothetical protein
MGRHGLFHLQDLDLDEAIVRVEPTGEFEFTVESIFEVEREPLIVDAKPLPDETISSKTALARWFVSGPSSAATRLGTVYRTGTTKRPVYSFGRFSPVCMMNSFFHDEPAAGATGL